MRALLILGLRRLPTSAIVIKNLAKTIRKELDDQAS